MMANGGLERLMSNPSLRRMAENMQSGGGMPDISQLAGDPSLRDMYAFRSVLRKLICSRAQQFMGGQGRGAGGA